MSRLPTYACLLAFSCLFLSSSFGATYLVLPDGTGDFPTIMDAIIASANQDIIELGDGVFTGDGNRDMNNWGKWIYIRSQSGDPTQCVIDCEASAADPHFGIALHTSDSKSDRGLAFEGITIRNGYFSHGGGMQVAEGGPTVENCIFENNIGTFEGGAVNVNEGGPLFIDCVFRDNHAPTGGGIYYGYDCIPRVENCLFVDCTAPYGGAIYIRHNAGATEFRNITFSGGGGDFGAYIHSTYDAYVTFENSIFAFAAEGVPAYCDDGGTVTLTCCDVYGSAGGDWVGCIAGQNGVGGNFSLDPLFCDPSGGDFTLDGASPCLDAPGCDLVGAYGQGCGIPTSTEQSSWGAVKEMFR